MDAQVISSSVSVIDSLCAKYKGRNTYNGVDADNDSSTMIFRDVDPGSCRSRDVDRETVASSRGDLVVRIVV